MPEAAGLTRLDVTVAGGQLATFRLGTPATPTVIAVHGITSNSLAWVPVARALETRVSLIALDLRGRGASSDLPGPYGTAVHAQDILAVLDSQDLERAVLVGHSLGAYVVARVACEYPDRVAALVLVDGGLTLPGVEDVDPQEFVEALLGPALARLGMTFATRAAYHDWWRAHPALTGGRVADDDLVAYANHDLAGEPPEFRSTVNEAAIRADAGELAQLGHWAHRLALPASLLCAPRGLVDEPNPMQPFALAQAWAAADPDRRQAALVDGVNHYTITLGATGASAVAREIEHALERS